MKKLTIKEVLENKGSLRTPGLQYNLLQNGFGWEINDKHQMRILHAHAFASLCPTLGG